MFTQRLIDKEVIMDFIGIALIIAVVVGAVHFVHTKSYKQGLDAGIDKGRMQVLNENAIRASVSTIGDFEAELMEMVERVFSKPSTKVPTARTLN
jgi:hypothetical protein